MRVVPTPRPPCATGISTAFSATAPSGRVVALRHRDAKESVTSIAEHLGIDRSTLYRTLAAYDEAAATPTDDTH